MGGPGFTWGYCWATRMAGLVFGESSDRLLVRSVGVSGRCYGIPAAAVCCHNTHGEKPDHHSHADIVPFSCGQDSMLYKALPSDVYMGLLLSKTEQ